MALSAGLEHFAGAVRALCFSEASQKAAFELGVTSLSVYGQCVIPCMWQSPLKKGCSRRREDPSRSCPSEEQTPCDIH